MGAIDVAAVRADTPGCGSRAHLNNAGASLPPRPVLDAQIGHLRREAEIGGYEANEEAAAEVEQFYPAVAELIGAQPDEIAYVENATRAWDMAFYAIPFQPGHRILTTTSEYSSNGLAFQQVARRYGVRVDVLPDDEYGQLSIDALEAELKRGDVQLVAINHVPTHNGLINPAAEIGRRCRAAGVLYLLDACQSVGQLAVNVQEIGCDLLSATGRKFLRGPRGTGFLYARRDVIDALEPPFLDMRAAEWTSRDHFEIRADARRFETWERSVAGQIALGVAARYAHDVGPAEIEKRVIALADDLRTRLGGIDGVAVHDRGVSASGIVTFTVDGYEPAVLVDRCREQGINVSASRGVNQRFDRAARPVVRASVHYYNTSDELARLLDVVETSVGRR